MQLLKSSVGGSPRERENPNETIDRISNSAPAAVLYLLALAALYRFTNKYTALLLLISGAVAGQFLFVHEPKGNVGEEVVGAVLQASPWKSRCDGIDFNVSQEHFGKCQAWAVRKLGRLGLQRVLAKGYEEVNARQR